METCVEKMLTAGACIDGFRDLPTRPLVTAAHTGHIDVLEMLVGRGADLGVTISTEMCDHEGDVMFPLGSRALHAAVRGNRIGSVRCLLKAGSNPDVINSTSHTPLTLAYISSAIVGELLKGGANPAFANGDSAIALHMYAINGAGNEAMGLILDADPSTLNQVCSPRYVCSKSRSFRH